MVSVSGAESKKLLVDNHSTSVADRLGGNREIIGPGMGAPGGGSGRLVEMLDAVRQEFEGISHDNSALKNQREEFEAKGNGNRPSVMKPSHTLLTPHRKNSLGANH